MIVLKHVKYKIRSVDEFDGLISLLEETTSAVEGVQLQDILFPKGKEGFLLSHLGRVKTPTFRWQL